MHYIQRSTILYVCVQYIQYTIYKASINPSFVEQITPYFYLRYNGSSVTRTVVGLTATKFKPPMFSMLSFALSFYSNIWIMINLYEFCLMSAVSLWLSHKHSAFWKPLAYRGPVCASENCQCCREPYFAGTVFSKDGCLPQNSQAGQT
jgi:hypothetical protein